jgi:hypothetical protein
VNTTALLTKVGPDGQELFFVNQSAVLGSSGECDLAVRNAAPKHCRLFRSGEGFEVRDLTGQRLIKINGKATSGSLLQEGDVLEVGLDSFRFSEVLEAQAEPESASGSESEPPSRPSRREIRRIPDLAPRLEKSRGGGSSAVHQKVTPSESVRRIPVVPIALAGVVVVGILTGLLLASGSSSNSAKAPGVSAKSPAAPGTSGDRRPQASEASLRPTAPASREAAASVERPAANSPRDPVNPVNARERAIPGIEPPKPLALPALPATRAPAADNSRASLDAFLKDPSSRSPDRGRPSFSTPTPSGSPGSEVLRATAIAVGWNPNPWDLKGPQGLVWSAYAKATSFEALELLTPADHVSRAQTLLEGGRVPLFRLFALAHLVEALAGDPSVRSVLEGAGYRQTADGKRWGEAPSVFQQGLAQYFREAGKDDPALESQALASTDFGTRYLGLLVEIDRSLRRGAGFQAVWNDLAASGAPEFPSKGAAHLRALAESYRKAVYCGQCKLGRVLCSQCQGKARTDLPCPACKGEGRLMAPGAANGALVSQRCNTCDGRKVFKQVGCATCSRTGTIGCSSCGGNPWHENGCTNPICRGGWVRCQTCRGGGRVDAPCADCNGTGRVMASGAANGAVVTQKCRMCQEDHGVFKRAAKCPTCAGNGLVRCSTCQGKTGGERTAPASISDVFTTEACAECAGSGWPSPRMAIPCPRCFGLGVRVKPAADATKTLD